MASHYPTIAQLAMRLRVDADEPSLTWIAAASSAYIEALPTRNLPDAVAAECFMRFSGYLFDAPEAPSAAGYSLPFRNSGALALIGPWLERQAGIIGAADGESATSSPGGAGIDQAARDAAAAAQRAAEAASAAAGENRSFLSTFADRVRTLVESIVPAWARQPSPPDGSAGAVADGAVTTPKLADDAVTSRKIAAGAVTTALIADDAVTGAKIPRDAIDEDHLAANAVGASELAGNAVGSANIQSDAVLEVKLSPAVRAKLNAAATTGLIPKSRIPHYLTVYPSTNPTVLQTRISGEKDQDLVIGYSATEVKVFRFSASANVFQEVFTFPRSGRSDSDLETFIERIVSAWAVQGNADGIPGSKTFDGLFTGEQDTPLPAANTEIDFDVGTTDDADVVDETDAEDTSFNITAEQANQSGAFIRCRWTVGGTEVNFRPTDVELLLQVRDTGAVIGEHNLPVTGLSTTGTAEFPVGDAGAKRWAIRVVTKGRYHGNVMVTEATYHGTRSLADPAIEHVVHPIVSVEADERQAEDRRLTAEIARVEGIKAIVNGLPAATATRKTSAIQWETGREPYKQKSADAFVVPATGFVQFILGNLGATPIMRAEDCVNRQMGGIYTFGTHTIGLDFDSSRRAILIARDGAQRSSLSSDIVTTTVGYVMLHWATARAAGHAETELAELETRVEALEEGGGALTKTLVWDESSNSGAVNDHNLTPAEVTAIKSTAKRFTVAIKISGSHEFWAMGDLDLALFRDMYGGAYPSNFNLFTRVLTGADASVADEMTVRIRNNSGSWELRIQGGSGKRYRVIAALWE